MDFRKEGEGNSHPITQRIMSEIYSRVIAEQKYPKKHTYATVLLGVNPYEIHIQDDVSGKEEVLRFEDEKMATETFQELAELMESVGELDDAYEVNHPTHINFYGGKDDLCWISPYEPPHPITHKKKPSKAIQSVMDENGWDEETAVREVMKDLLGENHPQVINAVLEARKHTQSEEQDAELVRVAKEAKGKKLAKAMEEHKKKKREENHYKGDYFQVGKYSFENCGYEGTFEILKRSKTGFLTIKGDVCDGDETIRRRPKAERMGGEYFRVPWNNLYICKNNTTKL